MKGWSKKLILILAVLILNGLFFYSVKAATDSNNINVQMVIPSTGGSCTNCNPPDTTLPTINDVLVVPSYNTAAVTWVAGDNIGISSVNFEYGTTQAYGLVSTPGGSYSVNLSALTTSTVYYYKITVVDSSSNSINYTGSFQTLTAILPPDNISPVISSVASSTDYTTASVTWSAGDNKGLASVSFEYGTSVAYGTASVPNGSYVVNLSGLATDTIYFFKITAVDTSNNTATYLGALKTASYIPIVNVPTISNILATPAVNSAIITFVTDQNSTAQINYGESVGLGSSATEGLNPETNHTITLLGLAPNKTHYFQIIVTNVVLNSTSSAILNFKTLADVTPPPDVSNLQITTNLSSFTLNWSNPSLSFVPDFVGVKILRKVGVQSSGPNDTSATVVHFGSGNTLTDSAVVAGFTYFYTAYSYDSSGNYSSGNFVQGKIIAVVVENCTDGLDNNNNGLIDCADTTCSNDTYCQIVPKIVEICNNNIDDSGDGKIDCADTACTSDQYCKKTDATSTVDIGGALAACSDGKDSDDDGLIDFPADPGCTSDQDNDEYNPPKPTVPEFEKLTLDKLKFFAGSRQIELTVNNNSVFGLSGSNLSVGIKKSSLIGEPKSLILRIGDNDKHQFSFDASNNTYYADVLFSQNGKSQAFIEINYGADQMDSVEVNLIAVSFGQIVDDRDNSLAGVVLTLHKENGDVFPAQIYGQKNPQITNGDALVGWMVPTGKYYITATKDNFYDYSGQFISVDNNIVNPSFGLVTIPLKIKDVIDPKASIAKNVVNVAENIAQKANVVTAYTAKQVENAVVAVQEVVSDPEVKRVANTVVAPTAVGVAAVGTVALVSWADIIPLLRFLFLQPLLVLGRGKREKWGTVYNSLSKMPVDLALVRLINVETGKLVQTKVTSSDGRYFFGVNAGKYRLEARKGAFAFPSLLLKGYQTDGNRLDVYHGEEILVSDKGSVITANIPLDPAGQVLKTPLRMIIGKMLHRVQGAVSWIGLIITLGSLYISPTWYMWVLLGVHLAMTFAFKRLAKPPITKGWGIVYDEETKKPLSKVVARLFDSKFNKLVATEITGADGKYYFMAGDNQYYVAYDREGYESLKTDVIDLKGKEAEAIAKDVNLKKK